MHSAERETLARRVLERSRADALEVLVLDEAQALTRFTHDVVHQNVDRSVTSVRVRAIDGDRVGVASTTARDERGIDAVASRALELARFAPPDPARAQLTAPAAYAAAPPAAAQTTRDADPETRARAAGKIFTVARNNDLWAAGYVTTSASGVTIANSNGTSASFDGTEAAVNVKMNAADATGFGEQYVVDSAQLDAQTAAERAAEKARATAAPQPVDPGEWTVILEPAAFGELLAYLFGHFSAQSVDDGSSFLSESTLPRFASGFSLVEDFTHPIRPGMPFDYEGTPTQRVALIDDGAAGEFVTDAYWAQKLGRPNTGHALPAPNAYGPHLRNPVVLPGSKSLAELVAQTQRGLYISRFWYIRDVDHRKTIVTGMTRDGTYLIENGKLGGGVRNMRFNQSIVDALASCEVANELVRTGGFSYGAVVPAVKIERFRFTSGTEF